MDKHKNNTSTIGVIIPVYNSEKYIEECLDSISNQSYKDLEIIVINDGSTDNSAKICDNYALRDKRITVVHQKNSGVSAARNVGIDCLKSRYMVFVDSDDIIDVDMIKVLRTTLLDNSSDIAVCGIQEFGNAINPIRNKRNKSTIIPSQDAIKKLLYQKGIDNGVTAKLYKRELFQTIQFQSEIKYGEDLGINYHLILKSTKLVLNSSKLYYYRKHDESAMNKQYTADKSQSLAVTQNILLDAINSNHQIIKAAIVKLYLEALYISQSIDNAKTHIETYNKCLMIINNYSLKVLLDNEAKLKHRLFALITTISPVALIKLYKAKNWLIN